ncbi:cell division protein FtsZ [Solemya velum gill symbiont]|uniref:Cell division protein FtsZ n=1 Tax=Solemya velum gill symbiont TaxID=2340 RepID=A0A1T2D160_SOVGS|nr:cell division protein FtsZ [Solemya velum gill symbiont]OOY35961.1 cell division protein FtsZ [Solemya velum gill symbiont]OOY38801.1 cell division protein FtsZ [Solemya velum gill symbiont]OOY40730.1 cell division protein FtsZ [Solemya velum gill symbiont]OOY42374.1 cell division protein FtsZ [Solemya velum gill symbiont]OOY48609.1 cell division protein FtsZ [Solemya velum gill symbiont]
MFEIVDSYSQEAEIKVIGVGGGGGNAVSHMLQANLEGVDFICANTDVQALNKSGVATQLPIGTSLTKGLGAGANPQVGHQAALEDKERIKELLHGADMVFITAGMGGGTGTGAAPVVAEVARDMGVLTVAVVTKPFGFEGKKRMNIAEAGIEELRKHVDSLITIPNEKLREVLGSNMSLLDAFNSANDVLLNAVQGIAELITKPGLINVDFADVRTVMSEMGIAMMGSGAASGEDRARDAAEIALQSPLLEDIDLAGAKGVLVNITAGLDLSIGEFDEVGVTVKDYADEDATVVVGTVIDPDMQDELRVTVVATGLGGQTKGAHKPVLKTIEVPTEQRVPQRAVGSDLEAGADAVAGNASGSTPAEGSSPYAGLDEPTVIRRQNEAQSRPVDAQDALDQNDMDYLDIPAFLRRQAD